MTPSCMIHCRNGANFYLSSQLHSFLTVNKLISQKHLLKLIIRPGVFAINKPKWKLIVFKMADGLVITGWDIDWDTWLSWFDVDCYVKFRDICFRVRHTVLNSLIKSCTETDPPDHCFNLYLKKITSDRYIHHVLLCCHQ